MGTSENTINCPKCGTSINVNEIIYSQIEGKYLKSYEDKKKQLENDLNKRKVELEQEKYKLETDKAELEQKINSQVQDKVHLQMKNERKILEQQLLKRINEDKNDEILALQNELEHKSTQIRELNKTKADLERIKREKEELREAINAEKERELNEKLTLARMEIAQQTENSFTMQINELKKQLNDQKQLALEMKRKAEQGSMQLQGEVQELAIEQILTKSFPFDEISEVGKGIRGADIIHRVRNQYGVLCGTIIYESKRTKQFQNDWIGKLKSDAVASKADLAVIITEAMPEDIDKIGQKDGVWITNYNDFKTLIVILRDTLIKISDAYSSQTNKGEKMQMLYDYLMSNEFKLQLGAIIEGFTELQIGYVKEKQQMERIWKQREKQLEKVLLNTNHFIGSIKGIAGASMSEINGISVSENLLGE